jgi:RNA polymerase sigma-70 factor (ECF subfamily)
MKDPGPDDNGRVEVAMAGQGVDPSALVRGDPSAVETFYREYAKTVLRWVIRLGGPGLDAEDVAHDVFTVALRKITSYRTAHGSPSAWLFGITRRVVANARRRARFRRFVGLDSVQALEHPGPGADVRLDQLKRRRLVQEVLDSLSDAHREVLVLVDLENRTAPEVAEMVGISVGTVYSRVHHARKQFGEGLKARRADLDHVALRQALAGDDP